MANSMTGFGKTELNKNGYKVYVEIKTLNNKYLDIYPKMPKYLNYFENTLKNQVKAKLKRGKVDIFIDIKYDETIIKTVDADIDKIKSYIEVFNNVSKETNLKNNLTIKDYISLPEVLILDNNKEENEQLEEILIEGINETLDKVVSMREKEGKYLVTDILQKLDTVSDNIEKISVESESIEEEYRNKLFIKIDEIMKEKGFESDQGRIIQEAAIFADKSSIDEEITRFQTHITQFKNFIQEQGLIGRKLDFLVQEMNREINTIGSKTPKIEILNLVVDTKTCMEQIREQIQNLE